MTKAEMIAKVVDKMREDKTLPFALTADEEVEQVVRVIDAIESLGVDIQWDVDDDDDDDDDEDDDEDDLWDDDENDDLYEDA